MLTGLHPAFLHAAQRISYPQAFIGSAIANAGDTSHFDVELDYRAEAVTGITVTSTALFNALAPGTIQGKVANQTIFPFPVDCRILNPPFCYSELSKDQIGIGGIGETRMPVFDMKVVENRVIDLLYTDDGGSVSRPYTPVVVIWHRRLECPQQNLGTRTRRQTVAKIVYDSAKAPVYIPTEFELPVDALRINRLYVSVAGISTTAEPRFYGLLSLVSSEGIDGFFPVFGPPTSPLLYNTPLESPIYYIPKDLQNGRYFRFLFQALFTKVSYTVLLTAEYELE